VKGISKSKTPRVAIRTLPPGFRFFISKVTFLI